MLSLQAQSCCKIVCPSTALCVGSRRENFEVALLAMLWPFDLFASCIYVIEYLAVEISSVAS